MQILHTRLRTNCSSLNYDLFLKNILESPLCTCGEIENSYHYFFRCRQYEQQRIALFHSLSHLGIISLDVILRGDPTMTNDENVVIFEAVHLFIEQSKLF